MKRWGVWCATAVILCVAAGCATSTSARLGPDAVVKPDRAYLYGRFFIDIPDDVGSAGKQSIGMVLQRERGSTYTFGASHKRDVQVMQVPPGRYWFMRVVYADELDLPQLTVPVERKDQRPLDLAAGHAYYLGDYVGKTNIVGIPTRSLGMTSVATYWHWMFNPVVGNHYAETTAEMKRAFPNLAGIPTSEMPLVLPREHKRDNGIGPSPGEPPMSPARVALLAPFVKQNYKSPAQCESACPAGQCLPYRGEAGAAIACVIRCDADADCPQGLLCTCPNREKPAGPGCTPIASTPKDPLARVCVAAPAPEQQPANTSE